MNTYQNDKQMNVWSWDQQTYHQITDLFDLIQVSSIRFGETPYLIPAEDGLTPFSFADLHCCTLSMHHYLSSIGVEMQQRLAVIYPNSTLMALLFLTIIASGRVLIPINPKSGHSEVEYILKATSPKLVLSSDATAEKVKGISDDKILIVNDQLQFISKIFSVAHPKEDVLLPADPVAEIVFTSGTTGDPKGVVLTHRNIISDSFAIGKMFEFYPGMNFLTTTPLFHNSGQIPTTMVPLWCGGTTTPIRPELGLIKFDYFVNRFQSNWSFVTPSFIAFLIASQKTENISSLEGLFVGGAKLSTTLMKQFEARFSIPLYEAYGLTETTSFATCVQKDTSLRLMGSAGIPLFINELRIHKTDKMEVSGQEVGEIIIKGVNVFKEYLDQPELTTEKKRDGWFHSGDLGYMVGDDFFIIDRIDNMIIVGGENVYPTEIEQLIPKMEGVIDGVLTSRPHSILGNELVLVYEAEKNLVANSIALKKILGHHLSNFKIPSVFVNITELGQEELPRADNGKILRKKLYDLVNGLI